MGVDGDGDGDDDDDDDRNRSINEVCWNDWIEERRSEQDSW